MIMFLQWYAAIAVGIYAAWTLVELVANAFAYRALARFGRLQLCDDHQEPHFDFWPGMPLWLFAFRTFEHTVQWPIYRASQLHRSLSGQRDADGLCGFCDLRAAAPLRRALW